MRRTVVCVVLAVTGTLLAPTGAHAQAQHALAQAEAAGTCAALILGVDPDRRLTEYLTSDGQVTDVQRSDRLPFDPTALVVVSSEQTKRGSRFTADASTADGRPRQLVVDDPKATRHLRLRVTRPYPQHDFTPDLFTDTAGYVVYTAEHGRMYRYLRIRERDGDLRFGQRTRVPVDAANLTTLQFVGTFRTDKRWVDFLVGTTANGALKRIKVWSRKPQHAAVSTLAPSGFEGVTGLSVGGCDDRARHIVLYAVDPAAGTATWSTIRNVTADRPSARIQGDVTGAPSWDLHAVS